MEQGQKNKRMELVQSLILKTFQFLQDQYSYIPIIKVGGDDIFIDSLEIEYVNEIRHRKIRISYTKAKVYQEIKHTFNASITRIPYLDVEDFFSLSNYLQSIGKDFWTSLINDFNETKAEKILVQIALSLKEYALSIINGEEWLETYYPRKD